MTWLIDFIAQGGSELKTRDGRKATQVTKFDNVDGAMNVAAVVSGYLVPYMEDGSYLAGDKLELDLMPPIKRYWHYYDRRELKGKYHLGYIGEHSGDGWIYQDEVQIIPVKESE